MNLDQNKATLSLHIGTPAQTNMSFGQEDTPSRGMLMSLPISEIDFFDKNPRRLHDVSSYAAIKESIRSSGIQQPVHVTQRPGESKYVLAQGGNTRLKILCELLEETGDNRFRIMCFWDKACKYAEIRDIFQDESDSGKLSLRELEVMFSDKGLTVSHKTLGLFFFASQLDDSFQYLWSDVLEQWHNQYSATELDVHELYQFVLDRFKFEYGSDAFSETENSSDKDKIETAAKQDVNLHQKDSDMEFVPAKVNGTKADAEDEPKEAEPITLEQTSKKLFSAVRKLLAKVSLSDCFKIHKDFPYGWYVEYPAFEHISASSAGNAIYAIDVLHEEAGNVFTFLWKLSGIDTFMFDVGDSSNPLLTLKSDSKLRIAYEDPDKYDEYTNCGIGNKENIIASLLNWQTNTSHEFHANIVEILSLSTQYNNLRKTGAKSEE
ncbi:TPA: ParB N-terminal domain-containing protein [Neisseria gonorrhoeae]